MSVNCIKCGTNRRTGGDLLCDSCRRAPKRLPPSESNPRPLIGLNLIDYTVGEWCPTPDGTGEPTAVAISLQVEGLGDVVLRLKSPQRVDELIQMLLRHKRGVWPESR